LPVFDALGKKITAKPVYGIFEGGGAKGIGHIAGLKAAEITSLEFIGVAGASAGALIAALVAIGYKADELFDPNAPLNNILSRNGISPISLLGEREWALFEKARIRAGSAAKWAVFGGFCAAWIASRSAVRVAREINSTGGFFSTGKVRETLNAFLRDKLLLHHADEGRDIEVPERVRFRDMDPVAVKKCCSLKVIVTDITNRRMVVFSNAPEFAARIPSYLAGGDALYADGGLVSNLPVWVFADEKLNYERQILPLGKVPVVAFTLGELAQEPPTVPQPGSPSYWASLARSAIFGGQTLGQLLAADLKQLQMPIRLGVTEFGFTTARVRDGYNDAHKQALLKLRQQMEKLPALRSQLLREYHEGAATLLEPLVPPESIRNLRVSLIRPLDGTRSFRVENSFNMDNDADDRLVFSRLALGAPEAFNKKAPTYIDFADVWSRGIPQNMTKYEFALLRKTLNSAICLPIFLSARDWSRAASKDRASPLGVVSIDSDGPLIQAFHNRAVMQALATRSLALAVAL
jgi:NTE family protein